MAQNNCYIRILLDIHISPFMSFLFFALLVKTLHGPLALIFAIYATIFAHFTSLLVL